MKNYIVIGLGKFGLTIAKTLYENGNTVLALDKSEELVQQALDEGLIEDGLTLDVTDETSLKNVVVGNFDTAFVCIGSNMQDSILVTLMLKEMNVKNIICKAKTKIQGKVLEKVGASQVVYPEELMGEKIALSVMRPSVVEYFKFSDEYSIFEIRLPEKFEGQSLKDLDLRNKYMANVIAVRDEIGELNVTPSPFAPLNSGDTLILIGKTNMIDDILK